MKRTLLALAAAAAGLAASGAAADKPEAVIAKVDVEYQAAVERNDWPTMDRILHPDFVLITRGRS